MLSFTESTWLEPYILKNSKLRQESKNLFENDLYKLMNNSVYGKVAENVTKRINFYVVNDLNKIKNLIKLPEYESRVIFRDTLVRVQRRKTSIERNKPTYIGMRILVISK